MSPECLVRKRIWEVDCISMDTVLAASFDWKELFNMLGSVGCRINPDAEDGRLEMVVQCTVHHYCHKENRLSVSLEKILNIYHRKTIDFVSSSTSGDVMDYCLKQNSISELAGLVWAVSTDNRPKFDCVRRRLHQRLQVLMVRQYCGTASREASV